MSWIIEVPRVLEEDSPFLLMVSSILRDLEANTDTAVTDQYVASTSDLMRSNGIKDNVRQAFMQGYFAGLATADPNVSLTSAAQIAAGTLFWCTRDSVADDDLPELGPS